MKCVVPGCTNARRVKNGSLSFHRFPTNNALREEWLKSIGLSVDKITHHSLVCSDHFAKTDFVKVKEKCFLVPVAVPNLDPISGDGNLSTSTLHKRPISCGCAIAKSSELTSRTSNEANFFAIKEELISESDTEASMDRLDHISKNAYLPKAHKLEAGKVNVESKGIERTPPESHSTKSAGEKLLKHLQKRVKLLEAKIQKKNFTLHNLRRQNNRRGKKLKALHELLLTLNVDLRPQKSKRRVESKMPSE